MVLMEFWFFHPIAFFLFGARKVFKVNLFFDFKAAVAFKFLEVYLFLGRNLWRLSSQNLICRSLSSSDHRRRIGLRIGSLRDDRTSGLFEIRLLRIRICGS